MKLRNAMAAATTLFILSAATPARADVTLTPFVGALFGGQLPDSKPTYGISLTAMGAGIIGGEIDFSWTPNFVDATPISNSVTEANLMANLIVGIPIGGTRGASFRPYVVGGIGLLRATAKESDLFDRISRNDFAWDAGGGFLAMFNTHVGLRADARYIRSTSDSSNDYRFWRGTGGLALKF